MKNYTEKEIEHLIIGFRTLKLPKSEWTHEAHLIVAIWYCSNYNFEKALVLLRENIKNYNQAVGTPNTKNSGYHESITKFWLIVAKQFIEKLVVKSTPIACNKFINSELAKRDYPLRFYTSERLFSIEARHSWVKPDLNKLMFRVEV